MNDPFRPAIIPHTRSEFLFVIFMPATYNGIGTHYYGKINLLTRAGICAHCRNATNLFSYDTRLWFVVLFIPVIPLGRKRVLDECPSCTRHRVMSLKEWETVKAEQLAKALAAVKASPDDAEAAIRLHGALVAFGQPVEAEKLGDRMREQFAQDARTQVYLASISEHQGRPAEALSGYRRALALDPELAAAKVPVGLDLIKQQKLEEAHELLRFLEDPNAPQDPAALFALGCGYQQANRHREALALFTLLGGRFPQLGQDKSFRATVRKSEVATGSAASALPPRRVRLWPTFAAAAAIAGGVILALVAVFGSNYYISQHRSVHLVNGLNQAVTVDVAGRGSVTVGRQGWRELELPEGAYRATVRGAVTQTVDFVVAADYFDRWLKNPVWVLNTGGSALLVQESTLYSASPTEAAGSYQFHFGEPFLFVRDVDYAFAPFPHEIQVRDRSKPFRKTRIGLFHSGPAAAFYGLVADRRMDEAFRLAEWSLRRHPEDTALLVPYVNLAQATQREAQCRALLAEAVQRRPVEIEWHRMHQQLRSRREELPDLLAEYDALLKADPENSALLYLRGRLCAPLARSHSPLPARPRTQPKQRVCPLRTRRVPPKHGGVVPRPSLVGPRGGVDAARGRVRRIALRYPTGTG